MMVSDFGEGWVGSPIEQWTAVLLKSGVLFWFGGFVAWASGKYDLCSADWLKLFEWVSNSFKPVPTLLCIFGLMVMVSAIANIVKQFDLVVLRFLEGYCPFPRRFWAWRRDIQESLYKIKYERYQDLAIKSVRTPEEDAELARIESELVYIPENPAHRMPTDLGNFLRAVEMRPEQKYGLNAFVCWHRLWLVLPEPVKKELAEARDKLDTAVRVWSWGALFIIWTVYAWWALPVSILAVLIAYRWILQAARIYGQLVEAAFDLHRFALYESLRWQFPDDFKNECEEGKKLTAYLFRNRPR